MNSVGMLKVFGLVLIMAIPLNSLQIADNNFLPGILQRATANDITYQNVPPCDGTRQVICTGCQTIKICLSLTEANNPIQPCPTSTPYCDSVKGACSATPDDSQAACSTAGPTTPGGPFFCTGKGIYPNPYSCLGYYYCEEEGVAGDLYQCPPGYKYNGKVQLCQRVPKVAKLESCKALSCSLTDPVFNAYPYDAKYYYYCQYDASDVTIPPRILMIACDDGATFDSSSMKCIFKCPREGMFAKTTNKNAYYQCYKENNRKLVYIERTCPLPVQVFDEVQKVCVTDPALLGRKFYEVVNGEMPWINASDNMNVSSFI